MDKEKLIKNLRKKMESAKTIKEYEDLHEQIREIQRSLGYVDINKPNIEKE